MKKLSLILAIFATIFLGGCASTTQGGAVGVNRTQLLTVSEAELDKAAASSYTQVISQAKSQKKLNTNAKQTKRVKTISNRLINQVGVFRADARNWNWQVNVIEDPTVNAWCMPGGRIAVYTGIINKLSLTDGELAAVVGHEIAHALREHSRERASTESIKNLGISIGAQAAGLGDLGATGLAILGQYGFSLPFSRSHETEADIMGLELMARAGYNPNEAPNVWRKMAKLESGSKTPEFFSTHPGDETRIKNLEKTIPVVMPLYEQAKKGKK
ncbi:M48 family metalloprotease [Campylobacter sp. JMF_02 ED1]|uniref:M48 family metallopeptidase n=1 Tax=unclassified Campylobacter TaxID=2593542 RepID=UPI0022E9D80C|nr:MULTISPECIES: M48 family metallopeptidase [unclassified Campylobacter]MDA3049942.1 M48 family metalloprotease [Campylobacter sp. JMF_15 NE4]MDA3050900.1 M48 family metalloprotease [Campylobacter sp. JMF_02 ED1]